MLEGGTMKLLLRSYRFLLFLLVSWFIYTSSNIPFFFLVGGPDKSWEDIGVWAKFIYLFGGEDLSPVLIASSVFMCPIFPADIHILFVVLGVCLLINVLAGYLWCLRQTPIRAGILALAGGIAGHCSLLFL